jgi:hypothetical protein
VLCAKKLLVVVDISSLEYGVQSRMTFKVIHLPIYVELYLPHLTEIEVFETIPHMYSTAGTFWHSGKRKAINFNGLWWASCDLKIKFQGRPPSHLQSCYMFCD